MLLIRAPVAELTRTHDPAAVRRASAIRILLAIRARNERILRAARVIPEGYWTAYGELGLAATGKPNARAVARLAAGMHDFPNAWRVIHADGSIPDGWGGGGHGPEKCRALLEAESVQFINGRADPEKKVLAEEIELLLAQAAFPVTS